MENQQANAIAHRAATLAGEGRADESMAELEKLVPVIEEVLQILAKKFSKRNLVEEMMSECFLHLVNKIQKYDSSRAFRSWFYTLCKNKYIDQFRRETRIRKSIRNEATMGKAEANAFMETVAAPFRRRYISILNEPFSDRDWHTLCDWKLRQRIYFLTSFGTWAKVGDGNERVQECCDWIWDFGRNNLSIQNVLIHLVENCPTDVDITELADNSFSDVDWQSERGAQIWTLAQHAWRDKRNEFLKLVLASSGLHSENFDDPTDRAKHLYRILGSTDDAARISFNRMRHQLVYLDWFWSDLLPDLDKFSGLNLKNISERTDIDRLLLLCVDQSWPRCKDCDEWKKFTAAHKHPTAFPWLKFLENQDVQERLAIYATNRAAKTTREKTDKDWDRLQPYRWQWGSTG